MKLFRIIKSWLSKNLTIQHDSGEWENMKVQKFFVRGEVFFCLLPQETISSRYVPYHNFKNCNFNN